MKIIIAGGGKIGSILARQLSAEGHDLTLIDINPDVLTNSQDLYDLISVEGNCASMATLQQAQIEKKDLLIAATGADEVNLLCCLTAHQLNPSLHTIARIRDPEYVEQAYKMQDAFGLSLVINPERQTASEIANLLKYPGFLKRETLVKSRVQIVELQVDHDSRLHNVALSALPGIVRCQMLVCAVLRDGDALVPDGRFVLKTGDRIYVTAPTECLPQLLKNLGIITHKAKRIFLAGCDRTGYYLAASLSKTGVDVTIVDKDPEHCRSLAALLPENVNIVCGDVSSQDMLESEGLSRCDALVSLTGMDEMNMVISLYANSCGVPQIITKLGRENNARVLSKLPIGSVVSPSKLCCNTIVTYVRAMKNQIGGALSVHLIADGQMEAIEFRAGASTQHLGEPLRNLNLRRGVLVVAINRGDQAIIPNGDTCILAGDSVVVVSSARIDGMPLSDLNGIFQK